MKDSICLIVEQGAPFKEGDFIPLKRNSMMIAGRKGTNWNPDLCFNNLFVSRKQFAIYQKNHQYYIKDLNSKHGTFLNQKRLKANEVTLLNVSDEISLGNDLIRLSVASISDETSDIGPLIHGVVERLTKQELYIDSIKREFNWQGETFKFSDKEFKCIEFLLQKKDQFVSKEELIQCVWPERIMDVSNEEINSIIYRIRKKTQNVVGIENIRGKGFILSFIGEKMSISL
ncbi:winged helix-turn-helix domain-containing protein [Mesobacillus maritimus]|uniref:FHA domain-containing protein n=1 Tax=Mesobacillus maritimus TaxID=1643336 RepID=UPI00203E5DB4|nr:FHA domain-containing protein [Mesobacillus maritimus]MCM3584733.1 winged helix-turn-helix domain-containing protein [Mesobacillus maritimus]